jgi:hypothetical protein
MRGSRMRDEKRMGSEMEERSSQNLKPGSCPSQDETLKELLLGLAESVEGLEA